MNQDETTVDEMKNAVYILMSVGFICGFFSMASYDEASVLRMMSLMMAFMLSALILAVLRLKD